MEKRGSAFAIAIIAFIVIVLGVLIYFWYQTIDNVTNPPEVNDSIPIAENQTNLNDTQINDSVVNDTEINNTEMNQTIDLGEEVPNPAGTLKVVDRSNGEDDAYYCNDDRDPDHQARLYTYRIIDGKTKLSENYIESNLITDVCAMSYGSNINTTIYYELMWSWTPVENIDGYRVYQLYREGNITRDYNYYIDLSKQATFLVDTGLSLWRYQNPDLNVTNSTV